MEEPSNPLIERELEAADNDGFSLIDGSPLDDLLDSVSEASFVDNDVKIIDGVNMLERPETEMPTKKEKYNLRKSLAWDSAFFTSAGVLDAEELSSIIEGSSGGRNRKQHLPGIQEDISKSTDSLSTLESDNLTLESIEADLFCDIRALIQKSGESSNLRKSNSNGGPEETNSGSQPGNKKTMELHHGNMVKPKSVSKKLNTNLKGDGKLMKLGPVREQVRKPVSSRREPSSSLLKAPAASGKGSLTAAATAKAPTKRMVTAAGRVKSDTNNVGNAMGRGTTVEKGPRPGDSRSIIPNASATLYAKSSSCSSTSTRTGISSTRSSYDSTSGSSSGSSRVLLLNGLHGKTNRTASVPPPSSRSKLLSRVPLKGKSQPRTSRISAYMSTQKLSPSVSPTSSISEWSSCSSTTTFSQEHSVSKGCSNLHRTVSLDTNASQDLQLHPIQQTSNEHENGVAEVSNASAHKLAGNGSLSNPVSAKPSGLRMPSPKIGFFDGVKAGGRIPNAVGGTQSRSSLPSSRFQRSTTGSSSPSGVSNKGRIGHAVVKATAVAAGNSNLGTPRSNARMTLAGGSLGGNSAASEKASNGTPEDVSKTKSAKISGENNSAAAKLPGGGRHLSEPGSSSRKKSGLFSPKRNTTAEGISHFQDSRVESVAEANHHSVELRDDSKASNIHLLHELIDEDRLSTELHVVNLSPDTGNAAKADDESAGAVATSGGNRATIEKHDPIFAAITDQQNVCAEQQVNELSSHVEAVGNNRKLSEETNGNLKYQSDVDLVSDSHSPRPLCAVELSGFIQKEEAADPPKQTELSVSSKHLESKPGSRMPFADKNSLTDANVMEALVKNFNSLSLDNVQANDVETELT